MNNQGAVEADWGDGTYSFRLTVPGAIELESKCGAPITTIINRVHAGEFSITDIRETIRLGLIGGGMSNADAIRLVRQQIDDRFGEIGLDQHHPVARLVLLGAMFGFVENPLAQAAAETVANTESSTPPPSTPKRADLDLAPTN